MKKSNGQMATANMRSIGQVARALGVLSYEVESLLRRGNVPMPIRVGRFRFFDEMMVEAYRLELTKLGKIKPQQGATVTT